MRKSGKELRKEYQSLLDKKKGLQIRIIKRAEELIKKYPDVVYFKGSFKDKNYMTVAEYQQYFRITPKIALTIIEKIEQHISDQHPHQQTELFKK